MRKLLLAAAIALFPLSAQADPKTVVDGAIGSFIDAMHAASLATWAKLDPLANQYVWSPVFTGVCDAFTWKYALKAWDANFDVKTLPAPNCAAASGKVTTP